MQADTDTRRIVDGMTQWTFDKTFRLVGTSYLWLAGLTAPAMVFTAWLVTSIPSGTFVDSLGSILFFFIFFVVLFAVIAAVGAAASLPFSHLLGRGLRNVHSRYLHTFAHSALAGVLAAVSMQILLLMFEEDTLSWQYPVLLAVPAGAAAAIARWRLDIVKPAIPEAPSSESEDAATVSSKV